MRKTSCFLLYLLILVISIFTIPWNLQYSIKEYSELKVHQTEYQITSINKGSLQRRIFFPILGFIGACLYFKNKKKDLRFYGSLGWLILLNVILSTISILWAIDSSLTSRRVIILIITIITAVGLASELEYNEIVDFVFFVTLSSVLVSLLCEIIYGTFQPFDSEWRFGGIIHPVSQG